MQNESATIKYANHPLFSRCIGCNVPGGWTKLIDELVVWIDQFNIDNKTFIGFTQIKIKFDMLTVYIEHYTDADYMEHDSRLINKARKKVNDICSKANLICKICAKEKTELVVNSIIKNVCLEHMHSEPGWWKIRAKKHE